MAGGREEAPLSPPARVPLWTAMAVAPRECTGCAWKRNAPRRRAPQGRIGGGPTGQWDRGRRAAASCQTRPRRDPVRPTRLPKERRRAASRSRCPSALRARVRHHAPPLPSLSAPQRERHASPCAPRWSSVGPLKCAAYVPCTVAPSLADGGVRRRNFAVCDAVRAVKVASGSSAAPPVARGGSRSPAAPSVPARSRQL